MYARQEYQQGNPRKLRTHNTSEQEFNTFATQRERASFDVLFLNFQALSTRFVFVSRQRSM